MTEHVLEATGLTKLYPGVRALDDVDFALRPGEVHVLFGENGAGKSTLISMLAGANRPTSGTIRLNGREVSFADVGAAQEAGIFTVFQEFSLIPTLSVAENIFLGREPRRGPFVDHRAMKRMTREIFQQLDFPIDPGAMVATLSRAAQQMVEIAKAHHGELSVLILDEPTASLTDREVDHLFEQIAELKSKGVGVIYISHRIQEFARIADRVTVLRDGALIGTLEMADADDDTLVEMMTGREVTEIYPRIQRTDPKTVVSVDGLSTPGVEPANFEIMKGEVLGIAGLVGCGKSRLVRALMGVVPRSGGTIRHRGEDVSGLPVRDMIARGFYYLSPDRKAEGLDLARTSHDNLATNVIEGRGRSFVRWSSVRAETDAISDRVELDPGYRKRLVSQVSGGNQQKVLFGKCFAQPSEIFILDEPTVGVDVGTRAALYRMIRDLAENGNAVIVVSSDLPEVLNLSHRLLVMAQGRIVDELEKDEISEDRVLRKFFEDREQAS
ncbi:sugar ABC transporter ATP-binding protein [Palleronia pelagia]|uniref:Ribose transport system ATP-binding protein n=1 Tax=Palleronia pelagia TaxID=387096 RepID=A0A1H8AKL8_9RHOB|nr:sugar ABC transporter ATP-binding protein [Palleronia pelagia]SEM71171.1 ribose transport system ATP-binding protein [Palleronia pelagia]